MVLLKMRRDSRVMTGNLGFLLLALKSNLPFGLRGGAGDCARVTAGQKRPNLGLCPGSNVALQGRQGSRVCIPDSSGESVLTSRVSKEFRSRLESRWVSLGAHCVYSRESSLLWSLERGLGIGLQAMQEKKALISR